jgi:hypothetical protein
MGDIIGGKRQEQLHGIGRLYRAFRQITLKNLGAFDRFGAFFGQKP